MAPHTTVELVVLRHPCSLGPAHSRGSLSARRSRASRPGYRRPLTPSPWHEMCITEQILLKNNFSNCLPMILGYAAASRFIHCVLDFHRSLAETHQALRVKPPLSTRGQRICDQILALTPHPLPYLVTSAIRPQGGLDLAARHMDFIRQDIQDFLFSCEVLSCYISQSNPLCQQEAAVRLCYLTESIRLDVELLKGHLVTFSKEATVLSHVNTLHGIALPAHPHSEMQIDDGQVDSGFLGSTDFLQSAYASSPSTLRLATPPRDVRMGVLDTRSDDCLPFVGSSHPQPPDRSMLPQSQAMPPGTSITPSAPQASTAMP